MERSDDVRLLLLGDTRLFVRGVEQSTGGPRQRAVLALLALSANHTVSVDRLIDDLWDEHAALRQPRNNVQVYVSSLRRVLRPVRDSMWITGEGSGYRLVAAPDTIDYAQFRDLAASGRRQLEQGSTIAAATALHSALELWSGELTQDLGTQFDVFAGAAERASGERLDALELRMTADLQLDRAATLVTDLQRLTTSHPMRERLWWLLMTALYRVGRQADALRTYQLARQSLADEAGLDPGPELRALELEILGGRLPIADDAAGSEHVVFVDELGVQRRVHVGAGGTASSDDRPRSTCASRGTGRPRAATPS